MAASCQKRRLRWFARRTTKIACRLLQTRRRTARPAGAQCHRMLNRINSRQTGKWRRSGLTKRSSTHIGQKLTGLLGTVCRTPSREMPTAAWHGGWFTLISKRSSGAVKTNTPAQARIEMHGNTPYLTSSNVKQILRKPKIPNERYQSTVTFAGSLVYPLNRLFLPLYGQKKQETNVSE